MANKKLFTADPNFAPPIKKKERLAKAASPSSTAPAAQETPTPNLPITAPSATQATADAALPEPTPVPAVCSKTTKKQAKNKSAKTKVKVTADVNPKKLSMVQAARQILLEADTAMSCKDLVEAMTTKGLWASEKGKTPANTLYSAFLRIIKNQGKQAPFIKTDKGLFALNPSVSQ